MLYGFSVHDLHYYIYIDVAMFSRSMQEQQSRNEAEVRNHLRTDHKIKHLQHTYETPETLESYALQHACICNIQIKLLQYTFETDEIF
jgi:hypothetical protein